MKVIRGRVYTDLHRRRRFQKHVRQNLYKRHSTPDLSVRWNIIRKWFFRF